MAKLITHRRYDNYVCEIGFYIKMSFSELSPTVSTTGKNCVIICPHKALFGSTNTRRDRQGSWGS